MNIGSRYSYSVMKGMAAASVAAKPVRPPSPEADSFDDAQPEVASGYTTDDQGITLDATGYPMPPLALKDGAAADRKWVLEHMIKLAGANFRTRFKPDNYNNALHDYAAHMAGYRRGWKDTFSKVCELVDKVVAERRESGELDWGSRNSQDNTTLRSGWEKGIRDGRWVLDFAGENHMDDGTVQHRHAPAEDQAVIAESWKPQDITAVLDGTFTMPQPDLGFRNDGECMLYSGKEHSIASEPECGKTWWVLMQVRAVLNAGGNVVYVDFEDDQGTIVGRLHHTLGVCADDLGQDRFRYVRPEVPPTAKAYESLLDFTPALVVLDGVTEGMNLLGLEINSNDNATVWRRTFVRPAVAIGAATLSTDHVVKDRDSRGRFAIGGGHKLAGLTGAMFKLEQVHPFGKGLKGVSKVLCTKDRNGGLRVKGQPTKDAGITHMGDLVGDSTGEASEWHFYSPRPVDNDPDFEGLMPPQKLREAVIKVKAYLDQHGGASVRDVRANADVANGAAGDALAWLVSNGQASVTEGARGARLHHLSGPEGQV